MEQEQAQQRSFKDKATVFLKNNGFFVVLGLCALCILIAVLVTLTPMNVDMPAATPDAAEARQAQDERLSAMSPLPTLAPQPTPPQTVTRAEGTPSTPAPSEKPASAPKAESKFPAPVAGSVVFGYASDTLLYSKTLEQWTTHEGVDIAAKDGTEAKAIRAGTVQRVYEDDALGIVVTVEHEGGYLSLYGNLREKPPVQQGQKLKAGDTVGLVGSTAVSECALEPHLHFSLYKNDALVDPHKHVLLEK